MVTINTTDDLLHALAENPRWKEAVRREILTEELTNLPARFDRFVSTTEAFMEEQRQVNANTAEFIAEQQQFNAEQRQVNANTAEERRLLAEERRYAAEQLAEERRYAAEERQAFLDTLTKLTEAIGRNGQNHG